MAWVYIQLRNQLKFSPEGKNSREIAKFSKKKFTSAGYLVQLQSTAFFMIVVANTTAHTELWNYVYNSTVLQYLSFIFSYLYHISNRVTAIAILLLTSLQLQPKLRTVLSFCFLHPPLHSNFSSPCGQIWACEDTLIFEFVKIINNFKLKNNSVDKPWLSVEVFKALQSAVIVQWVWLAERP